MVAEIHVLQPHVTSAGAGRLSASLTAIIAGGVDPGPRESQIRCIGASIEVLLEELRGSLADLDMLAALDEEIAKLERLAQLARTYASN